MSEQMYLIEIFIDKVAIFASEEDERSGARKNLIVKTKFGPKVQFIIKEGQLAVNEAKDDVIECDKLGRRKWTRTIRVGKSFLFPSYPDTVMLILSKFPLEVEVWNDDENEVQIFVGVGIMYWDTEFYFMLKETSNACKIHEPLSIKQTIPIYAECCCVQCGEVSFILRISALGESIMTEFQQLMQDPESFVFRTNRAPSMFQCKRIEGDDPNFCMVGSLYETTTLEDPDILDAAQNKIEVCTELQSCGPGQKDAKYTCDHEVPPKKKYPIDKIRMGDITGPCGNANCPLAHKVRTYIRNLAAYKKEASEKVTGTKDNTTKHVCGACSCKDDRWHREGCPDKDQNLELCSGCGGVVPKGSTCDDRKDALHGTGATPRESKTRVAYMFSVTQVPDYKDAMYCRDFIVENVTTNYNFQCEPSVTVTASQKPMSGCCCSRSPEYPVAKPQVYKVASSPSMRMGIKNISSFPSVSVQNPNVYTAEVKYAGPKVNVYNFCTDIPDDKDCKCSPHKPSPPCKTFDCECLTEIANKTARKIHKPFCPLYKHKENCPVNLLNEEEDKKEEEEDETEPLPYGLPPIKLGPCPIMGRPCTVPDGFARMYRNAVLPTLPPSYSDAGRVCCSKEYERIKKAIKDYMKYEKEHDFRCVNKFNVDTETRCCDKEQKLLALIGKGCCGSHKMAIQEKFKQEKK